MVSGFERLIIILEEQGFVDVILPFLLIFSVVYAVLARTQILGQDKKNLDIVVAAVMGLLVVIPHVTNRYPRGMDPVEIINNAIPNVAIWIIGGTVLLIMLGLFNQHEIFQTNPLLSKGIVIISIVVILILFGSSAGWWDDFVGDFLGDDSFAAITIIMVTLLVVFFIGSRSQPSENTTNNRNRDGGGGTGPS